MERREPYRTVAGFAFAPLVPWLLVAPLAVWIVSWRDGFWVAKVVLALSYGAGMLVGLPAHSQLRKRRIRDAKAYTLAGWKRSGLLVFVCMLLLLALDGAGSPTSEVQGVVGLIVAIIVAPFFAAVGACAGFVFWLVAVR